MRTQCSKQMEDRRGKRTRRRKKEKGIVDEKGEEEMQVRDENEDELEKK